ncbi:hypothetical protein GYMLUDRAFT_596552 [Collybiopsis luxurians FD-317 M1]|uniref:Uncharacterized protein n=1 Tax=Collybiopsis luxurians FD-317 M1 TaxID=944289 RepID=A0A0D0BYF3_9AGAR|nr:hypothetical protein GYMLUDRAFT_596552 [Collybiopsis luxurians FD-317 M1]
MAIARKFLSRLVSQPQSQSDSHNIAEHTCVPPSFTAQNHISHSHSESGSRSSETRTTIAVFTPSTASLSRCLSASVSLFSSLLSPFPLSSSSPYPNLNPNPNLQTRTIKSNKSENENENENENNTKRLLITVPRKECTVDAMALVVLVFGLLSGVVDANMDTNASTDTGTDTGTSTSTTALLCDSNTDSPTLDMLIRVHDIEELGIAWRGALSCEGVEWLDGVVFGVGWGWGGWRGR